MPQGINPARQGRGGDAMTNDVPVPEVEYKSKQTAFLIGICTGGIGGLFYAGGFQGIVGGWVFLVAQIASVISLFVGVGFFLVPVLWAFGTGGGVMQCTRVNRSIRRQYRREQRKST